MMAHTYNSNTWEAEAGGSLQIQSQSGLQNEFQLILNYKVRPYLKTAK